MGERGREGGREGGRGEEGEEGEMRNSQVTHGECELCVYSYT